jgi:hypothetical protein
MIAHMLPESGRVLGIDVGYSLKRPSTAFCCLSWTRDGIAWEQSSATAEHIGRKQALLALRGQSKSKFLSAAIDGPLKPDLQECNAYRTAERVLSRGMFQRRGKPGPTNGGSGPQLHRHATLLAKMVLQHCKVEPAKMPFAASSSGVYEAFPNLFLGVLCGECEYPIRPARSRHWTDCLFPLVSSRLDEFIQFLLPKRSFASVVGIAGHEAVAAFICTVTALAAAAGQCVAVGDPTDGYIVLPPLSFWGLSAEGERWAERELRKILSRLSCDKGGVHSPQVYHGAELLYFSPKRTNCTNQP